ncbi:hypothetical protein Tco_0045650, partial [Tanacetum coccineum]
VNIIDIISNPITSIKLQLEILRSRNFETESWVYFIGATKKMSIVSDSYYNDLLIAVEGVYQGALESENNMAPEGNNYQDVAESRGTLANYSMKSPNDVGRRGRICASPGARLRTFMFSSFLTYQATPVIRLPCR